MTVRYDHDAVGRRDPDAVITFGDGSSKRLGDCNRADIEVLAAWSAYKSAEASRTVKVLDAELERRRPKLKVVSNEEATK